jgi:hypothetical protein
MKPALTHTVDQQIVRNSFVFSERGALLSISDEIQLVEWHEAIIRSLQHISLGKISLAKLVAFGLIKFGEDAVIGAIDSIVAGMLTEGSLANLKRAIVTFPKELLSRAADPLDTVSLWLASEVCVHKVGSKDRLFDQETTINLIEKISGGEITREQVRQIKREAQHPNVISSINELTIDLGDLNESEIVEKSTEFQTALEWARNWSKERQKAFLARFIELMEESE